VTRNTVSWPSLSGAVGAAGCQLYPPVLSLFYFLVALGIEPRASYVPGKGSTTAQPSAVVQEFTDTWGPCVPRSLSPDSDSQQGNLSSSLSTTVPC
jgi:hypothetical protein